MAALPRLLLLSLLVVTLASCGQTSPEEHLTAAREHLAAGDAGAALIEAKNALSIQPKNGEARQLAGTIHLLLGDGASAEKEFQYALSLGESPGAIEPQLAQALYLQNDFDGVLEIDPQQAWLTPEGKADIRAVRGMALIAKGEPDAAETEFKAGQIEDRDDIGIITGLGWLAAVRQDGELAREFAQRALSMDKQHAEAWSLIGTIEHHEKNTEAARKAFSRAVALRPGNVSDTLQLIAVNIELEQYPAARHFVHKLRSAKIENSELDALAGLLAYQNKEYDAALRLFEEAIRTNSSDLRSLFYAGSSALELGRYESAALYLSRFNGRNPGFLPAMKMLAWLELRVGNYTQAEVLLRDILEQEPENVFSLNLLANALAKESRPEESVEVLKQVVKLSPDSAVARSRLGFGMMNAGMVNEGLAELESSRELNPERLETAGAIIFTLLGENRLDEALSKARELRSANPDTAYATAVLGTVHLQRKENVEAAEAFRETLALEKSNITARSGLASIAAQEGRPDEAKAYYREILEIDKGNLPTAMNLAYLCALDGSTEEMVQVLETAIQLNPNAVMPRLSLARHYEAKKHYSQVIELLEPVRALSGDNYEYLKVLTEAQYRVGQFQDARRNLRLMTQYAPSNTDIRYMYAVTLRRTGDARGAQDELRQVIEDKPEHIGAHFQLAEILAASDDIDGARAELDTLKSLMDKDSQELAVLEGTIASAAGEHTTAVAAFQRAFAARDSNINLLNLENATWDAGDQQGAIKLLRDWLAKVPDDQLSQFRLGGRYTELGQTKDAVKIYEKMLAKSPNSAAILNNLAWVLRDQDADTARDYAQRALELKPDSHEVKSTLAVLLKNRDNTRASQLIREALEASDNKPSYLYYQALVMQGANRSDDARNVLQRLLRDNPDFPEAEQAQALLRTLEK